MFRFKKSFVLAAAVFLAGTSFASAADVKLALVPGGPHPFFAPWEKSASDAKAAFSLSESQYAVPQEWQLDMQNKLIESLAAQGYNAFGIFPGDATGTNETMAELESFGALSVAIGGCTESPSPAKFCFATDVYRSAYMGTKALIEAMGGKGSIMHAGSRLVDPNTQLRIAAIEQAIKEAGDGVKLYQHVTDTDSQETGDAKINGVLAADAANIDGIIATGYVSSVIAARALENLGDGRIKMIGIDDDPIVLAAIEKGVIQGTMAQNPHGQGYIAAYALKRLHEGCTVKEDAAFDENPQNKTFVDSGTLLISKDNVKTYGNELKDIADKIIADFDNKYLACS